MGRGSGAQIWPLSGLAWASRHRLHAMCSVLGLEVIKLAILKATSLMSAVMKSDTFTGTAICKARITTRGPARETNGGRKKHIKTK